MSAAGSLMASGLLPQRNGSEGAQMKLQLLRLPVNSAGAFEELLMQFTSQAAADGGQINQDAPQDRSAGSEPLSDRQSMQEVIKGLENSGSEVLYEADEASLQDLERVVEALSGHIGISSAGKYAETLRQTLAGLLTDAEMAAAGLLLDQGPASSFTGGVGDSSSSSSSSPQAGTGLSSDAPGSLAQQQGSSAAHQNLQDRGIEVESSSSLSSGLLLQQQQQPQRSHHQAQQGSAYQHQADARQHAHHAMSTGQQPPAVQWEHNAALRASLARISSNGLTSTAQRYPTQVPQEAPAKQHASTEREQMQAANAAASHAQSTTSGSTLDQEDDDWLDSEPFVQPSEADLVFEAEAIADMVREANLTALDQQLQSLYEEYEWADEHEQP
ncbi:hypothetical protein WJX74_009890 [Apatococcus lobatus]|uniref:Uncharacterized protein n=1 Tax=Apatococcus lobatus TaxID=904363 RepID=A0AAW1S2J9_9CHLO